MPRPGSPVPSTPERREGLRRETTAWTRKQGEQGKTVPCMWCRRTRAKTGRQNDHGLRGTFLKGEGMVVREETPEAHPLVKKKKKQKEILLTM